MSKKLHIRNSTAEFLVFTRQAGESGIEVRVEDETVWLTQKLMAVLSEVAVRTASEHLGNLVASGEQTEDAAIRKFRTTAADGKCSTVPAYGDKHLEKLSARLANYQTYPGIVRSESALVGNIVPERIAHASQARAVAPRAGTDAQERGPVMSHRVDEHLKEMVAAWE